jgi:hypothetical protein
MAARVKVYVKKQLRLDRLTFQQNEMFKLGNYGLVSRKSEIDKGLNTHGGPAKPLHRLYAIRKSRGTKSFAGRGRNIRDLRLTGNMLRELAVRTVSEQQAIMAWTTQKNRQKAQHNEDIESFVSWSGKNERDVRRLAEQFLAAAKNRIVIEKFLHG